MTDSTVTTKDAAAAADAGVLAGVLREDTKTATETETAPVPARKGRRAPATAKTGTKPAARSRKAPAAATKPATGKAPAKTRTTRKALATPAKQTQPKAEANGSGTSARDANQKLAVELVDLVAGHFSGRSRADQIKIANWLKVLPTGGRAHERYWPARFARPTTSDWRKPE